jgi:hypothetical protein
MNETAVTETNEVQSNIAEKYLIFLLKNNYLRSPESRS